SKQRSLVVNVMDAGVSLTARHAGHSVRDEGFRMSDSLADERIRPAEFLQHLIQLGEELWPEATGRLMLHGPPASNLRHPDIESGQPFAVAIVLDHEPRP